MCRQLNLKPVNIKEKNITTYFSSLKNQIQTTLKQKGLSQEDKVFFSNKIKAIDIFIGEGKFDSNKNQYSAENGKWIGNEIQYLFDQQIATNKMNKIQNTYTANLFLYTTCRVYIQEVITSIAKEEFVFDETEFRSVKLQSSTGVTIPHQKWNQIETKLVGADFTFGGSNQEIFIIRNKNFQEIQELFSVKIARDISWDRTDAEENKFKQTLSEKLYSAAKKINIHTEGFTDCFNHMFGYIKTK